jgi:hypothetical protein
MMDVELTPAQVVEMLSGVFQAALVLGNDDVALAYPGRRKYPLFRHEQRMRRKAFVELADDCRKLVESRGDSARTSDGEPISAQRIADLEDALGRGHPEYQAGHLLSLLRLSLDIADTARTGITAVERRSFHQLGRRLREMQQTARPVAPDLSAEVLTVLAEGDPARLRGIADLLRYLDEVTRHPLLGWPQFAATDSLDLFLHLFHASERARRADQGPTPLDACLAARAVLANGRVYHLRVGAVLDLVLPEEADLRPRLDEWLEEVRHDGSDGTLPLSEAGRNPTFRIEKSHVHPPDLVLRTADRLLGSSKSHSVEEAMTALERTLYRKVYRQEGHKHQSVVLLRRLFDRALHSRHRRAMRTPGSTTRFVAIASGTQEPPTRSRRWPVEAWTPLVALAESLERARSGGWSPSGSDATDLLFPAGEERPANLLPDAEEFLRWALDCRGNLHDALARFDEERVDTLSRWLRQLERRCEEHDRKRMERMDPKAGRPGQTWSPTSPLLWFSAARELSRRGPEPRRWDPRIHDPEELLPPLDSRVADLLSDWQARMPWDQRQFGIWPFPLRGAMLRSGVRQGTLESRDEDRNPVAVEIRLRLLERELEFRCWMGARERVVLFESTLESSE